MSRFQVSDKRHPHSYAAGKFLSGQALEPPAFTNQFTELGGSPETPAKPPVAATWPLCHAIVRGRQAMTTASNGNADLTTLTFDASLNFWELEKEEYFLV